MQKFWQLPKSLQAGAFILLGFMGVLIFDQLHWWQMSDEYAFGYIVPFFVAFIIYDRWSKISAFLMGTDEDPVLRKRPKGFFAVLLSVLAFCMLLGGLFSFFIGAMYRAMSEGNNLISSNMMAFGFANILLGGIFVFCDKRKDGQPLTTNERVGLTLCFLFPALIWMLSVPMFTAVNQAISLFLMNKVAVVVHYSFDVLGFAIIREGSVLKLPNGDVGVEDACSGIRSLTACLFAGSFLSAAYFEQFWKKVFLVGTAMFFAFVNNILRSIFLTAWAYAHGPEGLEDHVILWGMDLGNVHDFTGWAVLGITVVCLFILVKIFSIRLSYEIPPEELNADTEASAEKTS